MREELDASFNVLSKIEKRLIKCFVFSCTDTSKIDYSEGKHRGTMDQFSWDFKNISMDFLLGYFEQGVFYNSNFPFLDETGIKRSFNIKIDGSDLNDPLVINNRLSEKYGLKLTLEDRITDVWVIRQN